MGSLEAGKLADMVILDEDPLADIKNVRSIHAIVKSGRVYSPDEFSGCVLDEAGPGADVSRRRELRSTALVSHSRAVIDETIPASQTNSWLTEVPNE